MAFDASANKVADFMPAGKVDDSVNLWRLAPRTAEGHDPFAECFAHRRPNRKRAGTLDENIDRFADEVKDRVKRMNGG